METHKVIIIGSGPAGLTAAIYAARADLKPLVLAGFTVGGQLMLTTEVENFPGFKDGIMGPELMDNMHAQAAKFGATFVDVDATAVDFKHHPRKISTHDKEYLAESVIIATGARSRWLEVPGEKELIGKGVSSCATCDGFFFRDKEIIVVGGGDSAVEEALFLTKFAKTVTVIHRRDELRATKIQQDKAKLNPKIKFIWDTVITKVNGKERIESVELKNLKDHKTKTMPIEGLFVAIGHIPNTEIFKGQLDIEEHGYLVTADGTKTKVPGVFVAGDVFDFRYKQAITAAGSGCKAAMDAEKYLEE